MTRHKKTIHHGKQGEKWNATFFVKHARVILIPHKRDMNAPNMRQMSMSRAFALLPVAASRSLWSASRRLRRMTFSCAGTGTKTVMLSQEFDSIDLDEKAREDPRRLLNYLAIHFYRMTSGTHAMPLSTHAVSRA